MNTGAMRNYYNFPQCYGQYNPSQYVCKDKCVKAEDCEINKRALKQIDYAYPRQVDAYIRANQLI